MLPLPVLTHEEVERLPFVAAYRVKLVELGFLPMRCLPACDEVPDAPTDRDN